MLQPIYRSQDKGPVTVVIVKDGMVLCYRYNHSLAGVQDAQRDIAHLQKANHTANFEVKAVDWAQWPNLVFVPLPQPQPKNNLASLAFSA